MAATKTVEVEIDQFLSHELKLYLPRLTASEGQRIQRKVGREICFNRVGYAWNGRVGKFYSRGPLRVQFLGNCADGVVCIRKQRIKKWRLDVWHAGQRVLKWN